jgi:hypothetical protein
VPTYLVESYVPRAESHASAIAAALVETGPDARLRWSVVLPAEDLCLHVLDGPSAEAVRAAAARADVRWQRISQVLLISPEEDRGGNHHAEPFST